MRFIILILLIYYSTRAYAQNGINPDFGARNLALSGISATLDGPDAMFNNYSALAGTKSFMAMASTNRRFSLTQLSTTSIACSFPFQDMATLGFSLSRFGFEYYNEQKLSVLMARKIFNGFSMSINLDYNLINIKDYGHAGSFSFGLGLSGNISETLSYGIYIFTPEKIEIAPNTKISSAMKFGLKTLLSTKLRIYGEIEKIIDKDINMIFALEYLAVDRLFFRIGTHTNPAGISFGIGYPFTDSISFDGSASINTLLGFTPGFSIKYATGRRN